MSVDIKIDKVLNTGTEVRNNWIATKAIVLLSLIISTTSKVYDPHVETGTHTGIGDETSGHPENEEEIRYAPYRTVIILIIIALLILFLF
jgi:hypothetical protein